MKKKTKNNLLGYFSTIYGYIFLALFYLVSGYALYTSAIKTAISTVSGVFSYMFLLTLAIFPFFVPLVWKQQKQHETDSALGEVLSKFGSTFVLFLFGALILVLYAIILAVASTIPLGIFLSSLIGLFLLAGAIISIQLYIAYVIPNYVASVITGIVVGAIIFFLDVFASFIPVSFLKDILRFCSFETRYGHFTRGLVYISDVVFFLCVLLFFLWLTVRSLAKRQVDDGGQNKKTSRFSKVHSQKTNSGATVAVALSALALCILTYAFLPVRADLSQYQIYSLAKESKEVLKTLEGDITITILEEEESYVHQMQYSAYFYQANALMRQYARNSSHVTVNYVDLQKNPDFIHKYHAYRVIKEGNIIVEKGDKYRIITQRDLFELSYEDAQSSTFSIKASKAESVITSAIAYVNNQANIKVDFLLNGTEHENYKNFADMLTENGYDVNMIDITYRDVDPDATLLVIFAPSIDFQQESMDKISAHMLNEGYYGSSIFYVANSETAEELPNLDALMRSWGMKVIKGNVCEKDSSYILKGQDGYFFESAHVVSDFYSRLLNTDLPVAIPYSRPLVVSNEYAYSLFGLLQSSDKSEIGYPFYDKPEDYAIEDTENGPYYTALLSSYYGTDLMGFQTGDEGHIALIGSERAFDKECLDNAQYNNLPFFLNLTDYISGREYDTAFLDTKTLQSRALDLSAVGETVLTLCVVGLVPLIFVAIGILVLIKNKKKREE